MSVTMLEAAQARSSRIAAPADRPSQRRSGELASSGSFVRAPLRAMELRESAKGAGFVHFNGYASVCETGYEMWDWAGPYTEVVAESAFNTSLNRSDLDVPLVLQHMDLRRIARTTNGTLTLTADATGLNVDAPELDLADQDVAYIVPKLRALLIDEMSFKFAIVRGTWSPDWLTYRIEEVDIHRGDVAIVGYGANPATSGELRAADLSDAEGRRLFAELTERYKVDESTSGLTVARKPVRFRPDDFELRV